MISNIVTIVQKKIFVLFVKMALYQLSLMNINYHHAKLNAYLFVMKILVKIVLPQVFVISVKTDLLRTPKVCVSNALLLIV